MRLCDATDSARTFFSEIPPWISLGISFGILTVTSSKIALEILSDDNEMIYPVIPLEISKDNNYGILQEFLVSFCNSLASFSRIF